MDGLMRLAEVPPVVFLAGYVVGAVAAWFAAWDWMRVTGRLKEKEKRA